MGVCEASLPKKTVMYRAQQMIREEDDVYYDLYWARLELHLLELKQLNPDFHVHVHKDPSTNRSERCFVGVSTMKLILMKIGLGFFGVDACHVIHHICKNM